MKKAAKQKTKIGTIVGDRLYLAEGQEPPQHCTHKIFVKQLVCVSSYQARHGVPQNHTTRNGIGRVS